MDAPADASLPSPRRQRVLIVDDNIDAAEALAAFLEMSDCEVRVSADPHAALALVESFAPTAAVLDIGLPGIDGCELATRIRASAAGRDCRLVAVTGYGRPDDRERTRAAGFAVHLVKPIELDALLAALRPAPH
jgi:CheY-like chemotaxis protein